MLKPYTIGCDPEVFVVDDKDKFVSAHDLVPGSKDMPYRVNNDHFIQPDGTAAEFNIKPASTSEEFSRHIREALAELQTYVKDNDSGLRLKVVPTAFFDRKYFKTLPAEALAFGCEPDFDAYLNKIRTFRPTNQPFRTGAGHLHVGWGEGFSTSEAAHIFDCTQAVKQLDSVLYFASLLWDPDEKRRELYGDIGSFRPKTYGVEYRPLSNMWVADPNLHIWIFETTKILMELLDKDDIKIFKSRLTNDMMQEYIDVRLKNKSLPNYKVKDYVHEMIDRYNLPPMPENYLEP